MRNKLIEPAIKSGLNILHFVLFSGRFNLDPNRVLDIMLDAFEFHLEEEDFFITLLKDYSSNYDKSTVCHILGFKYQFYKVRNINLKYEP
jgi:hypothetical protein